jgi:hypothetical protein
MPACFARCANAQPAAGCCRSATAPFAACDRGATVADPAERLLSRLEGVKRTGNGRWMARCPAHKDRTGSLSIRETDDGRCLVHCFAQCAVDDVVRAAGLELADLFPPRTDDQTRSPRVRRPFLRRDAILALRRELMVAWVVLADVAAGKPLSELDRKRAGIARDRCVALISELADD